MWVELLLSVENGDISKCLHAGRNTATEKEEKMIMKKQEGAF